MGVRHYLRNERRTFAAIGLALRGRKALAADADAMPYSRAQRPLLIVFAVLTVAEGLLFVLVGFGVAVHLVLAVVEVYSLLLLLGLLCSMTCYPHSASPEEVRVRYGAYVDVPIPADAIAAARIRREDHSGKPMIHLAGDIFTLALSWQTNVVLELHHPVTVTRPLGRTGEARTIRFYADDPDAAVRAITTALADRPRRG
ncbi:MULTISPECIES: hypothetical protein [Amycolatopsis]|uniref:Integral membrane protein n=1 Tax=Amycolatopsis thermalba TaxID=944492 RepID=A0ABY4NU73_9PSEU|nr:MULTISPECIES: hypothetical protein [Amycolatopsis]OXM73013.1 hypothetical protein CF166_12205 [Amycolatopsis sp. KNN50.9b]UQS23553.1 hypothetical protein L1857_12335 [Amycolatopsis thermalba]